jgi:ABC-type uncharacterized transport system permease subunit
MGKFEFSLLLSSLFSLFAFFFYFELIYSRKIKIVKKATFSLFFAFIFYILSLILIAKNFSFSYFFVHFQGTVALIIAFLLVFFLIFEKRYSLSIAGSFVSLFIIVGNFFLLFSLRGKEYIISSNLNNAFVFLHVVSIILGYGLFFISFLCGGLYLIQQKFLKKKKFLSLKKLPSLGSMENLSWRTVTLGFAFFTAGLLLGIIFFHKNPKLFSLKSPKFVMTISLWFIYGIFIVYNFFSPLSGKKNAIFLIFSFLLILATYLGIGHRIVLK